MPVHKGSILIVCSCLLVGCESLDGLLPANPESDVAPEVMTLSGFQEESAQLTQSVRDVLDQIEVYEEAFNLQEDTYLGTKRAIETRLFDDQLSDLSVLVSQWNEAQSALDEMTRTITELDKSIESLSLRDRDLGNLRARIEIRANRLVEDQSERENLIGVVDDIDEVRVDLAQAQRKTIGKTRKQSQTLLQERKQHLFLKERLEKEIELRREMAAGQSGEEEGGAFLKEQADGRAPLPLIAIRFSEANVDYESDLSAALNDATRGNDQAQFRLVALYPTSADFSAEVRAKNLAQQYALAVVRSLNKLGIDETRIRLEEAVDKNIKGSEVHIFLE